MERVAEEKAVSIARKAVGLQDQVEGRGYLVWRLDRLDEAYWLITLGPENFVQAAATVDARSGELLEWVDITIPSPYPILSPEQASSIINNSEAQPNRLVWMPCKASLSPFYPLWEMHVAGKTVFITQQRQLLHELIEGRA